VFKTFSLKLKEIDKKWLLIDAKDVILGRLAVQVANILRGKNKVSFTPHLDCGDNVIIINAKDVKLTGRKLETNIGKKYYWHTGHPGGIKEVTAKNVRDGQHPDRIIRKAVERMITRNPLGSKQMSNLYIYADDKHPHEAQSPQLVDLAALNQKNKR
jgi:large subunit ribosomal protein L13